MRAEGIVHVAHMDQLAPLMAVTPESERGIAVAVQA